MSDEKAATVLQPGTIIRHFLSIETAIKLIDNVFGLKAFGLKEYVRYSVGMVALNKLGKAL